MEELLTTQEFADELGVTTNAIQNAYTRGHVVPAEKRAPTKGGSLWSRSTVDSYKLYLKKMKEVRSMVAKMTSQCTTPSGMETAERLCELSGLNKDENLLETIGWLIQFYEDNMGA